MQNHDQLANSGSGERLHRLTSPSRYRAITTMFLLLPQTPMLFQGQEFAASTPFFYFADHREEIARAVAKGRADFLSQFRLLATPEMQARLPDPSDPMTFVRSKLDPQERRAHREEYHLHRDLLHIRREDRVFARQASGAVDGEIVGLEAFVLRFFGEEEGDDRLLVVNLGRDVRLNPAPLPLLAPPRDRRWEIFWTSEDARYGGWGTPPLETEDNWRLQGEAAVILKPAPPANDAEKPASVEA
jgi:maltooligosyltrehalose trehalohydrolase